MYITNICNMFRHTTLFCYVHLLNVTYVHKNFISCHVGLSFQKLKLLKNNHKILRPTTLISCRMMQEDWEGSDWKRKKKLTLISAFFPNLIWSVLIFVYIFGLILPLFERLRPTKKLSVLIFFDKSVLIIWLSRS